MPSPLPVLALLFNAFVWGLSWWPLRELQAAGVHPLWSTALVFAIALVCVLALRPGALGTTLRHPGLWLLALASGLTNVAFNWAITVGDVVRVVLLFYLMPAWSVLLAWKLLGERPTRSALLRLVLAFAGVALVIVPPDAPVAALASGLSLADLLAVLGGLCFALTNVMLRKLEAVPEDARMLAMFAGGAGLGGLSAWLCQQAGIALALPALDAHWVLLALGLTVAFLLGNYALQYGAARLPAGITALVMLFEVVVASVSSLLLMAATVNARTVAGGALIILAALLAARGGSAHSTADSPESVHETA